MFKIVRFPKKLNKFFDNFKTGFRFNHFDYFKEFVLLMAFSFGNKNVSSLYRHLDTEKHRTRFNNFLNKGRWDPEKELKKKALEILKSLNPQKGEKIYLIVDDSKKKKRGKTMDAVGKILDCTNMKFTYGHQYVTAILWFRGHIIPWGIRLYVKKEHCKDLNQTFKKTTEIAAELIEEFKISKDIKTVVLFDAFYLCKTVVKSCRRKNFKFISVMSSNRNLFRGGRKLRIKKYARNKFYRSEKRTSKNKKYRYTNPEKFQTTGLGSLNVIFSKKNKENQILTLVTDDFKIGGETLLDTYEKRWMIEVFFKDTKQLLGLGQYQNASLKAAVTHLHLVCFSFALLTHIKIDCEKDKKLKAKKMSTANLQNKLRQIVWHDLVDHLKNKEPDSMIKELDRLLIAA